MKKTKKKEQGVLASIVYWGRTVVRWTLAIKAWILNVVLRPGYEFYYANGFTKAAATAFTLIVNLILFVLLILSWASFLPIDLTSEGLLSSILKRHILWPTSGRLYVYERPAESIYALHQMITEKESEDERSRLEKEHGKGLAHEFVVRPFKVTDALAQDLALYLKLFLETPLKGTFEERSFKIKYKDGERQFTAPLKNFESIEGTIKSDKNADKKYPLEIPLNNDEYEFNLHKRDFVKAPLWFYIAALITAYVSLLMNIRATVESIVTPIPGGPLTVEDRQSRWRRILLRIPGMKTLQMNTQIFLMLPVVGLIFFAILEVSGRGLEEIEFGLLGTILTSILSIIISGGAFFIVYAFVVSREISRQNLILGALYGAFLWLFGRWLFTEYIAVSLYRNLKIFSLALIILMWFYYFCCAMLMGIHLAFVLQHKELKETVTSWIRKDSDSKSIGSQVLLQQVIHLDLMIKLGSQYENVQKFEINPKGWVNLEDIGNYGGFCRSFVNEAVFSFVAACSDLNIIAEQYNHHQKSNQYRFTCPPSEIDIQEIFKRKARPLEVLQDFEQYPFALLLQDFILQEETEIVTVKDLMERMQQNIKKQQTRSIEREQIEIVKKDIKATSKKGPRSSFSGWTRSRIPFHQSIGETKALKLTPSSAQNFPDSNHTEPVFSNPNYTEELTPPKFPLAPLSDSYLIPPSQENLDISPFSKERSFKKIYPPKKEDEVFAVSPNSDALLQESETSEESLLEDVDQFEILEEEEPKELLLSEEDIFSPVDEKTEKILLTPEEEELPDFSKETEEIEQAKQIEQIKAENSVVLADEETGEKFLLEEKEETSQKKKNIFLESLKNSEKIIEEDEHF